jgi:pyrroline-5-carboxylate reductase
MAAELVVVGGGHMGGALVGGLLSGGSWPVEALAVVEPDAGRRAELGTAHPGLRVAEALVPELVEEGTGAVLAVKPEVAEVACQALKALGVVRVLSIVAGMSSGRLEACLGTGAVLVRAMPNTAALVGEAASAIAGGSNARAADLEWGERVLGAVGTVVRVPERQLDAVTAVSGSGLAYLFLVVESLVEGAVLAGLPRDLATALVSQTVRGAGSMLAESGHSPEGLRAGVTSPGGTTAAALRTLEARAVRSAFIEAVLAAAERSRSLGR